MPCCACDNPQQLWTALLHSGSTLHAHAQTAHVSMSNLPIQVVVTECLFSCSAGVILRFLCSGVQQALSPCWECAGVNSKHVVPLGNSAAATLTKQAGSGGLVGRVNRACSVGLMVCVHCAPAQLRKASAQPHWRPCPCQALATRARSTIYVCFKIAMALWQDPCAQIQHVGVATACSACTSCLFVGVGQQQAGPYVFHSLFLRQHHWLSREAS